jgi:hypothetical protein
MSLRFIVPCDCFVTILMPLHFWHMLCFNCIVARYIMSDIRGHRPHFAKERYGASGSDIAGFEQAAHEAEQLCPVSNALRQNVANRLKAHLERE